MSKRKGIRVGVVGLGRIGWSGHCMGLKEHKDFELVAVSDVSEERCREAEAKLGCRSKTVRLPFREPTDEQIRGSVRGGQRFVDPAIYDRTIPELVERIGRLGVRETEVQALRINDVALAAVGGEYFVELGLRIKQRAWPVHARR